MVVDLERFNQVYEELPSFEYKDRARIAQVCRSFAPEASFCDVVQEFVRGKKRILDLCCGKPEKIQKIAEEFPDCRFVGIDANPHMGKYYRGANLSFLAGDIRGAIGLEADGILSLHACGDLSDCVVEKAAASSVPVLLMPCCYGKFSRQPSPASAVFSESEMLEKYLTLFRIARRLESNKSPDKERAELVRILFNYDRMKRLEEKGIKAKIFKLTDIGTPHNLTITGEG